MNCIFCEIIKGNADASLIYKNDKVTAFMDLYPINKGHVLVVPNEHHMKFTNLSEGVPSEMFSAAQKILKAIEKTDIACEGANIFLCDGEVAGQDVMHSHLHIAPRFSGDGYRMGFSGASPYESTRDQLDNTAKLIKEEL